MKLYIFIIGMLVISSGANATSFSCKDSQGKVIKMTKEDNRNQFALQTEDGEVYTCHKIVKGSEGRAARANSDSQQDPCPTYWHNGQLDPIHHHCVLEGGGVPVVGGAW